MNDPFLKFSRVQTVDAFVLRSMHPADVPAVLDIQAQCYRPETIESEATVRRRLACAPDAAWVAERKDGVCAYLVGYRSLLGEVTPLGGDFEPIADGDCLYLHDLAVARCAAGSGTARALVERAWAQASSEGLLFSALVSVQGSCDFWKKRGYTVVDQPSAEQQSRLDSYPGRSYYMVRQLAAGEV